MVAKELIKVNKLTEARTRLIKEVKASPSDPAKRTLLAQVLLFFGEWDKAERHLEILALQNVRTEIGVQVYRNLISSERERADVCAGKRRPAFLGAVPSWLDLYLLTAEKMKSGDFKEAGKLYREIELNQSKLSGVLNGCEFIGLKDGDAFLSPFLELFVQDQYLWLPFTSLRELSIPPPSVLLDTLWTPARITTCEGLTANCYLPVIYQSASDKVNDLLLLGRMTDWEKLGNGFFRGKGQHVFQIGDEEKGILEIRELKLKLPSRTKCK